MRRADRLFEILQILRLARSPVTAQAMARELEVGLRTIYRDVAALQAMRIPIEGERGLGYVLSPDYALAPPMLTVEESEAVALGLAMLERTGDAALKKAAATAARKIAAVAPPPQRRMLTDPALYAWGAVAPAPEGVDLALLRRALREERKLTLEYGDETGRLTRRVVRPAALVYYAGAATLVAWCELRGALRTFRLDRVRACALEGTGFRGEGDRLRRLWIEGWESSARSRLGAAASAT